MTDADMLLETIWREPAEDTPRLMYADEIEADDPERAEFIRVQCELARLEGEQGSPKFWAALRKPHGGHAGCSPWCRAWKKSCSLWAWHVDNAMHTETPFWGIWWRVTGWRENEAVCEADGQEITAVVRRGFIDEVRLPLVAFVGGGGCVACAGHGGGHGPQDGDGWEDCPTCDGTGTTPGLAAAVGEHPVTRVVLTDREPLVLSGSRIHAWTRNSAVDYTLDEPTHLLPPGLFDLLPPADPPAFIPAPSFYPTAEAARDALECGAAVAWARAAYLGSR